MGTEKNKKNRNIDILRALALTLVIIYHIWVLSGQRTIQNWVIWSFVTLGGEIGVSQFFLLSGFGIYCSLHYTEEKGEIRFGNFMKKRLLRVAPEYDTVLLFLLFFSTGAGYLSRRGMVDILSHFLFIHNLIPGAAGSINGVCWTMGNIMQFYLVAIPLYRLITLPDRRGKKTGIWWDLLQAAVSVGVTAGCKYVTLARILPALGWNSSAFWGSRDLPTSTLDQFVLGMLAARILMWLEKKEKPAGKGQILLWIFTAGLLAGLYGICRLGAARGIHTPNLSGAFWHSLVALDLMLLMIVFGRIRLPLKGPVAAFLLWVSRNEYGTYLLHLVMFQAVFQNTSWAATLAAGRLPGYVLLFLLLYGAAVAFGWFFTMLISGFREKYLR